MVFSTIPYNVMFPYFFQGNVSLLFSKDLNATINLGRVSSEKITTSTNPRSAERYGFANFSAYSVSFSNNFAAGSAASEIFLLKIISAAPLVRIYVTS